jgi:hypothetical protein
MNNLAIKRLHLIFISLVITLAAGAEDITTTDGRTYTAATITKVEPDGIRILHETGTAKIPFEKLPPALQQKHGYDPAKAAEFKKADAAAQAVQEATLNQELTAQSAAAARKKLAAGQADILKEVVMLYSHVYQVGETGILVKSWEPARFLGSPLNEKYKLAPLGKIVIYGYPGKDKLADNDVVNCLIRPTGETLRIGNSTYKTFQYFGPKPE